MQDTQTPPKKKLGRPKLPALTHVEKHLKNRTAQQVIEAAGKAGLTHNQLAEVLGTKVREISVWKLDQAFIAALKRGQEQATDAVEASLYVKARGFWIEERVYKRKEGSNKLCLMEKTRKYTPPDTGAIIFWLKNRRKDQWKDRREFGGDGGEPIQLRLVLPEKYPLTALPEVAKN